MKQQIEQLKKEIQEFLDLEKLATRGPWEADSGVVISRCGFNDALARQHRDGGYYKIEADADSDDFIAASRNISPAMAKMLLVAVDGLDTALLNAMAGWTDFSKLNAASPDYERNYKPKYGKDVEVIQDALNEILSIWEGAKRG